MRFHLLIPSHMFITAPPSVYVPEVIGALACEFQTKKKKGKKERERSCTDDHWAHTKCDKQTSEFQLSRVLSTLRYCVKAGLEFVRTHARIHWNVVYKAFHRIRSCGKEPIFC